MSQIAEQGATALTQVARTTTGADQPYWNALAAGRLELPRCRGCGRWHWPAVWRCGDCGSWDHDWVATPLIGSVFTWTRTWHPFGGLEGIGVPFVTVVVALEGAGQTRMVGILDGADAGLQIGAKVEGRVGDTPFGGDRIPSLRWRLSSPGPSF